MSLAPQGALATKQPAAGEPEPEGPLLVAIFVIRQQLKQQRQVTAVVDQGSSARDFLEVLPLVEFPSGALPG